MRNRLLITTVLLSLAALPAGAGWDEGVAAFKAGNYAQASKEFEAVVAARPDWANGHMMLGRTLLKLGRNQPAVDALRKAYDLNPGDGSIQLALAQGYLEANRASEAAQLLGRINAAGLSKEQQAGYQKLYAMALDRSGQGDRAAQELAKAAAGSPNDANLQYQAGAAALNAGNLTAAIAALDRAVRLDAKDAKKSQLLVQALIRQGREAGGAAKDAAYARAAEVARSLAAAQPTYDNFLLLGEAQLGASLYDEAVGNFNQAAGKNPAEWLPLFYIGQAHTATGNYPQAIDALQKGLAKASRGPDKSRLYKQLGFVYEKTKNLDQARVAYQNAGDAAGVERVSANLDIAKHNAAAEEEARKVAELRKAQEEARKALEEAAPPPF
jgi:tetratricopeptide (TPR) repeat protein